MHYKRIPMLCPSCGQSIRVRRLECGSCGTVVEGVYDLPTLCRLSHQEQEFTLNFIRASGSLKELARVYGVSYPTVRNRLDALIERLAQLTPDPREAAGKEREDGE